MLMSCIFGRVGVYWIKIQAQSSFSLETYPSDKLQHQGIDSELLTSITAPGDYRLPSGFSVTAGGAGAGAEGLPPEVAHTMMMIRTTAAIAPMINIIFKFCHQYFLFSLPACCSNWAAPCCKASARLSNSDNLESLSKTFSTLTRMIPTTSSTFACVCASRLSFALGAELPWSSIVLN